MSNTIYLNMKTGGETETVDQFTRGEDAPPNPIEFRKYVRSMVSEYRLSGQNVYTSSRCTKEWKNK